MPAFYTALGVGGATVIGALIGFLFKKTSHKLNDIMLSFAAGVMLSAAVVGLIVPSLEMGGKFGIITAIVGIFVGASVLAIIDKVVPHLHKMENGSIEGINPEKKARVNKVLLFVIAIGIHNFPEGLAAGVSFGTGDVGRAVSVALGIALQNIPEGMVIIAPMVAAGISRRRTFFIALLTGLVEVVGTMIGYFAVNISTFVLPFALAFAGGTMIYIISDELIPETHSHGYEHASTYALLVGFAFMLAFDFLLAG